jgi:hypothetical protein
MTVVEPLAVQLVAIHDAQLELPSAAGFALVLPSTCYWDCSRTPVRGIRFVRVRSLWRRLDLDHSHEGPVMACSIGCRFCLGPR